VQVAWLAWRLLVPGVPRPFFSSGKIVEIDLITGPERLRQFDPAILTRRN
jgi:hypothetical protein